MSFVARIRAAMQRRRWRPAAAPGPAGSAAPVPPGRFAFLTSCYDTPPQYVRELAASIAAQTAAGASWVLLDNGSTNADTASCLDAIARAPHVQLLRVEENRGILGGMRACLEAAPAEFVVPVDADDLVAADAVAEFAAALHAQPAARFLFADEDHLTDGRHRDPFRRPGWDPALALASSYVWHPCCFDRRLALELGVHGDAGANYCHDWDTLLRFVRAGHVPVHVPKLLYSWRTHVASTTNNRADAHDGSLRSQRHVLQLHLDALALGDRFAVEDCPLWRGAPELRLRRLPRALPPLDLLVVADSALDASRLGAIAAAMGEHAPPRRCFVWSQRAVAAPAGWAVLAGDAAAVLRAIAARDAPFALAIRRAACELPQADWPLELLGWLELVADLDVVGARALDARSRVLTAGDFVGADGELAAPDRGRDALDPGYLALALKPRCCDAVHSGAVLLRGNALAATASVLARAGDAVGPATLGAWLAAAARAAGRRAMTTPFATAVDPDGRAHLPAAGQRALWRTVAARA